MSIELPFRQRSDAADAGCDGEGARPDPQVGAQGLLRQRMRPEDFGECGLDFIAL